MYLQPILEIALKTMIVIYVVLIGVYIYRLIKTLRQK
jgi:hypothetical protein